MPHDTPEHELFAINALDNLAVVLVSPRNTLNIGAVARAMSNFGCLDLRIVKIFYKDFRKAVSAVGPSADLLAQAREFDSIADAVADANLVVGTSGAPGRDLQTPVQRLEQGAVTVRSALASGRKVALLFGSEKTGLSNDDLSRCHFALRIPTRTEHPSMNLGQAAALCLYELARRQASEGMTRGTEETTAPARADTVERLTALLEEALVASEFPGAGSPMRTRKLRALLRRLHLGEEDAGMVTGFLRQMLWKIRHSDRGSQTRVAASKQDSE